MVDDDFIPLCLCIISKASMSNDTNDSTQKKSPNEYDDKTCLH